MKIILGSNSKRRQELLDMLGIKYEVVVSSSEEIIDNNLGALENCINISYQKALSVKKQTSGDRIIITCDTIVFKDNSIIGKPKNRDDAYQMLKKLSNTSHDVYSCLTVIIVKDGQEDIRKAQGIGKVFIDDLTDEEIYNWIDNHNPYDKAGGYAIQEEFGKFISRIEGDYYSIVGLPLNELYHILKEVL